MIRLKLDAFPDAATVEVKVDCEKDAILLLTKESTLVIDRAGGLQLEGEDLKVQFIGSGEATKQSTQNFRQSSNEFSKTSQLWWKRSSVGSKLILEVEVPRQGEYDVRLALAHAHDYGTFRISMEPGGVLFGNHNCQSYHVHHAGEASAGRRKLNAGINRLIIQTQTPSARSKPKLNGFGLDYIRLIEAR